MMGFPERKMVALKGNNKMIEKNGYDEDKFTDEYWLYSDGKNPARINKDASCIVNYFTDIKKITKQENIYIGDIGAGAGNMVNQLRRNSFKADGCEFSFSGRRIAKEKFNIVLEECDLRTKLTYNDDHFEWSYCVGVLSMIPQECMKNALEEIFRITKYGVLINVGTSIANNKIDRRGNPHHLTPIDSNYMWKKIKKIGGYDWTSILPPQKARYGIGIIDEFAGLFGKTLWPF